MPTYGAKQKPAGVNTTPPAKHLGTRDMDSRNRMIKTSLKIENCVYKGNAVLNANK
jgi:hypothetical protein